MSLVPVAFLDRTDYVPRARGDEYFTQVQWQMFVLCSPRTRG